MVKHMKPGHDFFDGDHAGAMKDFGFSGSMHSDHKGGRGKGYADGGGITQANIPGRAPAPKQEASITMPASQAAKASQALIAVGRQQGANSAVRDLASAARSRRGNPSAAMQPAGALAQAAQAPAPVMPGRVPSPVMGPQGTMPPAPAATNEMGMAKGGFIKKAIKHPGKETARAKASGRSVHDQMEHDSHSSNKSVRSAGNLGLRLTKGDLKPKGRH